MAESQGAAEPFTLSLVASEPILHVRASGPSTFDTLCGAAAFGGRICSQAGRQRVLVDLRDTLPQLSFTEHIQLGSYFAEQFRDAQRVATLVHPRDRVGTSEKAAQRSGLSLRTFLDMDEAMRWLRE